MSQAFDTLDYATRLKKAGFTEEQANIQAQCFREYTEWQEKKNLAALATQADIAEINARIRETELRLPKEIQQVKYDLLKWQTVGWLGMVAIMAKGFRWLGF